MLLLQLLAITESGLSAFESCSGLCFLASEIQEAAMLGHARSSCDSSEFPWSCCNSVAVGVSHGSLQHMGSALPRFQASEIFLSARCGEAMVLVATDLEEKQRNCELFSFFSSAVGAERGP